MGNNRLDLSSLEKAFNSLVKAIKRSQSEPADEELRDAVIQRFEYTYELSWKMMKREMEKNASSPDEIDKMSFRDLFRIAAEKGIISEPEHWFDYREKRNITSHAYDSEKAREVYKSALVFISDVKNLLEELKKRNV